LTAAAVTAAATWAASLAMIAFTGLGRITFVANEGHWSATIWRRMDPVDVWTARGAGAALVICVGRFAYSSGREMIRRHRVNQVSARFGTPDTLVFVDDDMPHAYAFGGRRPRIVISRGLLRGMTSAERRTVLAHEAAHVRHRHDVHLMVMRLASAMNPLLRSFVSSGELAVERWADEVTAAVVGDRTLVARTLLRAALARTDHAQRPHGALAHASGHVGRRIRALLSAPPRPRWSVAAIAWLLLVATITAAFFAANNLDRLISAATPHGTVHVKTIKAELRHHRPVTLVR
jgi:beta-lactamase regulating signal transducer with metallopeptidase domain